MALQMRDAQAGDIAELARLDRVQLVLAVKYSRHLVEAGLVFGMDRHAFVPRTAVGIEVFVIRHGQSVGRRLIVQVLR
jgi:hypothetical protein